MRLAQRVLLLGVTVEQPEPVGLVHLPAHEGVTVLYGRNGAGKSTLLRAIGDGLLGVGSGGTRLHLRLQPPESMGWLRGRAQVGEVFEGWLQERAAQRLDWEKHPGHGSAALRELVERWLRPLGQGSPERTELSGAIMTQGLVSLVATGTPDAPSWDVEIGVGADGDQVSAFLRQSDAGWLEVLRHERLSADHGTVRLRRAELDEMRHRYENVAALLAESRPEHGGPMPVAAAPDVALGLPAAPSWVPRRLGSLGPLPADELGDLLPRLVTEDTFDADGATVAYLAAYGWAGADPDESPGGPAAPAGPRGEVASSDLMIELPVDGWAPRLLAHHLDGIVASANRRARSLLDDSPELRCELGSLVEWLTAKPLRWEAFDEPRGRWVDVGSLSRAQQRWSLFAIHAALASRAEGDDAAAQRSSVAFIDEPEAALHPLAQKRLFGALSEVASWTVVATHAPAHWDDPACHHFEVYRDEHGWSAVRSFGTEARPDDDSAASLGVSLSDYVRFYRTLLFVEGEHDSAVLDAFIGPELVSSRTWVVPLDGADGLAHLAASKPLFMATDAQLVVLLDHVAADRAGEAWSAALSAFRRGDLAGAQRQLGRLRGGTKEERLFHALGRVALETGMIERLTPFGLSKPDILFYLDPSAFVRVPSALAPTWEQIDDEWRASGNGRQFKDWLRAVKGSTITTAFVRNVARSMPVDRRGGKVEFEQLVQVLKAFPGHGSSGT